jgi:cellulose synthase/poly-beta-1,6-N-acetylglucosamine synthase-like glycosyltransferase
MRRFHRTVWVIIVIATALSALGAMASVEVVPAGENRLIANDAESDTAPYTRPWWVRVMKITLYIIIGLICIYIIRHYWFGLNRLFRRPRQPYVDIDTATWPHVTILVPAHNEEPVIADILTDLLEADYPRDRLTIMPINDRSEDKTGEIIDEIARAHPEIVKPFHRTKGKPGKAAALRDATEVVEDDIMLVFDADYLPGTGVIKQLVAPFFDPEVGAAMGRVVRARPATRSTSRPA